MRAIRSRVTNIGEVSSVQRPSITSRGVRRKGLSNAASETRRQNCSSAALAPSAPPAAWPLMRTAAFMAPAEVPEMPSISSLGSSKRRSRTPQVKAPCAPPPWSARSTRSGPPSPFALVFMEDALTFRPGRKAAGPGGYGDPGSLVTLLKRPPNQPGCAAPASTNRWRSFCPVSPTMRLPTIKRWQCSGSRSRHKRQTG